MKRPQCPRGNKLGQLHPGNNLCNLPDVRYRHVPFLRDALDASTEYPLALQKIYGPKGNRRRGAR